MLFFRHLFDSSDWVPRMHCGIWSSELMWGTIVSDAGIWLAYMLIPIVMYIVIRKTKFAIQFKGLLLLYVFFIIFCGQTHIVDIMMFWYPAYRIDFIMKFCTAVVSLATAAYIIKLLPVFLSMKTPDQVAHDIVEAKKEQQREIISRLVVATENLILDRDELISIISEMEQRNGGSTGSK